MKNYSIKENRVIPILKKLIQINTENPPGTTIKAIEYLATLFKKADIIYSIDEYKKDHANLLVEIGEGKESIILTGHIDTVTAGKEEIWKFNPFKGEEKDGKIYGRGTTDMKGSIAALVALILELKKDEKKLKQKVKLLITSDEESFMEGSKNALQNKIMKDCIFLVIAEPTDLNIGIAEKGMHWYKIKVFGKSAHGSRPELGINAIEATCSLFEKIKQIIPQDSHELLGESTLNISKIEGGAPFLVPEYCEFEFDYRLNPDINPKVIEKKLREKIAEFNFNNKATAELEHKFSIPALEYKKEHPLITALETEAQKYDQGKRIGLPYGTDGGILLSGLDIPFVIFGAGHRDKLHVTDEYIEKNQVLLFANILLNVLKNHLFL